MSRKCTGGISFIYFLATLTGYLALLLPLWVSGKFEKVRTVKVVKEVDSGLFVDHSKFYMKDDTIPEDSDDNPFPDISGTYIYPEVANIVKAFMIIGISFLSIALVYSFYRCCCHDNKTGGKTSAIVYVVISVLTIFSGGFIISCPFIYKSHVIADFEPENISLGASWWLCLVSASLTFLAALVTVLHSGFSLWRVISEKHEQSVPRGRKEKLFTIF